MGVISWENNLKLTADQYELVVGSLLGDARLECRSLQGTARLRIHHADSQKDYVLWKYEQLKNLVKTEPKAIRSWNNKYEKWYHSYYFHTITTFAFRELHRMFYQDNQKGIPKNVDRLLTPRALAAWIMDDGCYYKGCMICNTQSFSIIDQKRLIGVLKSKYNLSASLQKDRENYRIFIKHSSTERLIDLIAFYIIPSMQYKIMTRNDCVPYCGTRWKVPDNQESKLPSYAGSSKLRMKI